MRNKHRYLSATKPKKKKKKKEKKKKKKKASEGLWRGTFPRRFVHGLEPVHPVTLPSHPQQPQQDARDGQDVVAVYVGDALPASGLAELGDGEGGGWKKGVILTQPYRWMHHSPSVTAWTT